jgi:hypothetical protein
VSLLAALLVLSALDHGLWRGIGLNAGRLWRHRRVSTSFMGERCAGDFIDMSLLDEIEQEGFHKKFR